ncbi:MAG: TRAP transporter small permease subunit [Steroidobacteraceae bacterium]|nr:TRAP transporter small permease subunit [Steroidobacteraceae bacterium]MDW8260652.1 TRAP transporter small permease [Gammaproteobacteria bacterium]
MSSRAGADVAAMLLRRLLSVEKALTVGAFAVLIVVVFADVLLRRVTGSGLMWSREVGIYTNIWLTLLGVGIASASGAHLRPRFLDRLWPARWENAAVRTQELVTALGFAALTVLAALVVIDTRQFDMRSPVLGLPEWLLQLCLPVAFGFAALRHAIFAAYPQLRPAEQSEADAQVRP